METESFCDRKFSKNKKVSSFLSTNFFLQNLPAVLKHSNYQTEHACSLSCGWEKSKSAHKISSENKFCCNSELNYLWDNKFSISTEGFSIYFLSSKTTEEFPLNQSFPLHTLFSWHCLNLFFSFFHIKPKFYLRNISTALTNITHY